MPQGQQGLLPQNLTGAKVYFRPVLFGHSKLSWGEGRPGRICDGIIRLREEFHSQVGAYEAMTGPTPVMHSAHGTVILFILFGECEHA